MDPLRTLEPVLSYLKKMISLTLAITENGNFKTSYFHQNALFKLIKMIPQNRHGLGPKKLCKRKSASGNNVGGFYVLPHQISALQLTNTKTFS